jgi:hypothetical protein
MRMKMYSYVYKHIILDTSHMEPKWIGWKPGRSKAWRLRVLVTQDTKDDNIVGGATMLATAHSDTIHNAFYSRDQRSRGSNAPPHLLKILLTPFKFLPMLRLPTLTNSSGVNLPTLHRDLLFLPLVSFFLAVSIIRLENLQSRG